MIQKKNKVVCFGEVLWDDFGATKTIGGAPLNVCYHLSKLHVDPVIVSQAGNDELGAGIMRQLDQWQLSRRYCGISSTYPTSTVNVELLGNGEDARLRHAVAPRRRGGSAPAARRFAGTGARGCFRTC